jgi:hypothetical protein
MVDHLQGKTLFFNLRFLSKIAFLIGTYPRASVQTGRERWMVSEVRERVERRKA